MPVTARLSHRLHDALGEDAGGDLVTWMQTVDASRTELRELNELTVGRLESRMGEVRHELKADIGALREEMRVGFAGLEAKIDRRFADLIKWSFLFWCGAVAAAALARG